MAWFGERCGSSLTSIQWIGQYSFNTTTGAVKQGCIRYRSNSSTDAVWNSRYMGSCGVAPSLVPALPVSVCSTTTGEGAPAAKRDAPLVAAAACWYITS